MDAVHLLETYGQYPMAHTSANNEHGIHIPDPTDASGSMKRHAACDDCRKRKLKCSGELTGCSRCVRNSLICVFSEQKQMGRPKKRKRTDETRSESLNTGARLAQSDAMIDPVLSSADVERTNFQNVCSAPVAQAVRHSAASLSQRSSSMNTSPPSDHPHTPSDIDIFATSYPTDYSLWPDFSDTNVPQPVVDGFKWFNDSDMSSSEQSIDPDANPSYLHSLPSVPDCPCLPNLYLTLSTLSTLSSFPVSSQTVNTLLSAHRTARSVIYCPVCPQSFQSGSQNVMLSGTLLTVLVDKWQGVLKSPPHDLRKGFGAPTDDSPILAIPDLEWRTFAHDLIRHHVFADRPLPIPPNSTSSRNTIVSPDLSLMSLANAMERRQKQWHSIEPSTGEFPERRTNHLSAGHAAGLTLEEIRKYEQDNIKENNHLCLQLCKHAKLCIKSLDRAVPRLERACVFTPGFK